MSRTWYVRRGRHVKGPFPAAVIGRLRASGRLRDDDELSGDLRVWQPLADLSGVLLPDFTAPAHAAEGRAKAVAGTAGAGGGDRAPRAVPQHATGGDARAADAYEPPPVAPRSPYVERLLARRERTTPQLILVVVIVCGVLAVGGWLVSRPGSGANAQSTPDCTAPPHQRVNWSNCTLNEVSYPGADLRGASLRSARLSGANLLGARLAAADLAYADLSGVTLRTANLAGADLMGADLQGARLDGASLVNANLRYADLRGASLDGAVLDGVRLDNALWLDGRRCAAGSVGSCKTGG